MLELQHTFEQRKHLLVLDLGQHQRSPDLPERHADGGFVGAVACYVTHDRPNAAVGSFDQVDEVSTQHGEITTGSVERLAPQRLVTQDRSRHEPPLEPLVLGATQLRFVQPALRLLGPRRSIAKRTARASVKLSTWSSSRKSAAPAATAATPSVSSREGLNTMMGTRVRSMAS